MTGHPIVIKIILIATFHFLFSIFFVGSGLLLFFQEKLTRKNIPCPGNFLSAVSLGILYNAMQFGLVLLVTRKFPVQFQTTLSIGKYAMDLALLLFIFLFLNKKYFALLKRMTRVFFIPGNAALLLLALLLGFAAIINFPHVHDSRQLMATNDMLHNGTDFLAAKRYGIGFSALFYFPNAIFKGMPMATLAAGFKLFLLLLTGLAVIFGIDRLGTSDPVVSKFLYFFIVLSSYFGLKGLLELGKDSPWAVLFSLIFIFSLIGMDPAKGYLEPCLYLICAMALGMIAIPYLFAFCAIYVSLRLLPNKISAHKVILPAAVLLMLGAGSSLMPVKTALPTPTFGQPATSAYLYRSPLDGRTFFYAYFFSFNKKGYRNSSFLIIAGMVCILLLPLGKKRFADIGIRSTALFLPIVTLGFLLLPFLARGYLPVHPQDKIPLTPFRPFDAWNLVKDIPQWYVQIIGGIFFILFLDGLANSAVFRPRVGKNVYRGAALIAAALILSANFPAIAKLKDPASFYSYGGNKSKRVARSMESIYLHPEAEQVILIAGESAQKSVATFHWAHQNYFPRKKLKTVWKATPAAIASLFKQQPSLLVASTVFMPGLKIELEKIGKFEIRELEYFPHSKESISLISRK